MIIAKITDADSNVFYLGEEEGRILDDSVTRHYKPYIKDFKPTQRRIDKVYGGMVRFSGEGSLDISPDSLNWPPPYKIDVYVKDVDQHGRVTNFFQSTGYLDSIDESYNSYTLYDKEYDVDLLDDAPDWPDEGTPSETNRVYPLAIGTVQVELAMRIGNSTTEAYYYKAGITGTDPTKTTGDYSVYDTGYQRQKYGVGLGTIIDDTTYFKSILNSDGTTLNAPVTEFRISGTNANITTLVELFTWAVARINTALSTSYTLISTNARATSPSINYYAFEQQNIFDFLSEVCSWCSHLFYVDEINGEIVLADMLANNGTLSLSDTHGNVPKYLKKNYKYPKPLKSVKTEWTEYEITRNSDGYYVFFRYDRSQEVTTDNITGTEETVKCFTYDIDDIVSSLIIIGNLLQYPRVTVELPMIDGDIDPGLGISFTDNRLKQTSTIVLRVNTIQYTPVKPNYKITVEGYVYG